MLDKLNAAFDLHQKSLQLSQHRQVILAANIANADTPGYLARDIDFSQHLRKTILQNAQGGRGLKLAQTSPVHLDEKQNINMPLLQYRNVDQASVDGNTVDMDRERINFSDNALKYQVSVTLLNTKIKDLMNVINRG